MPSKKHIYFTGCTGETGKRLLNNLIARNDISEIHLLTRAPTGIKNPKVFEHFVDFDYLTKLKISPNEISEKIEIISYCTLGTTIKKAGSKSNFRKVDYDYVVDFAKWAIENNSQQLAVVSSLDANPNSNSFYLRTKGEMERSIKKLPWKTIWILRPSLLIGEREEFRLAEFIGGLVSKLVSPFLIGSLRRYRPINIDDVATALASLPFSSDVGVNVLQSDQIIERAKRYQ
jgi:nucleoside-diphosphate-sugar epimerase